ncbi:hypothetical protein AAFC00_004568 [Neodothiora populina]|uniref:Histidinol-phosphatase n=1 Tax=Neodothiora populina TaxID=2781224 RepID=A0ABR3P2G1_9PEZI
MPFSHHSHSGQFCAHAKNTLEEMIQAAIAANMDTFALTEHIPRDTEDLYPEEVAAEELVRIFDAFYPEALRLREKYASQITILIGFESEWIRESSLAIVQGLIANYKFDFFMGSLHHVHTIPIDFDHEMYYKARDIAGGSDEKLAADYFDSQYELLQALEPPIVGHFDLIRLKSDDPERNWTSMPTVWEKILRNLKFVASYGGILELNSSAIRKGMTEPYPKAEICKEFLKLGGRFTFSDDSHGTEQVGLNFEKVLKFMENTGINEVYCVTGGHNNDFKAAGQTARKVSVADLHKHKFFVSKS